jgi:hypothetical protein
MFFYKVFCKIRKLFIRLTSAFAMMTGGTSNPFLFAVETPLQK